MNLGERGFVSFAAEYNDDDGTIRNATRPAAVLFAEANPDLADQLPNYPNPVQLYGNSPSDGWKSMVNASFDVSDTAKIYAFGNFAHAEITESFNFRSPQDLHGDRIRQALYAPWGQMAPSPIRST